MLLKKYITNFYIFILPLAFLLFLAICCVIQFQKKSNDQNAAIYSSLVFGAFFFVALILFLVRTKVLLLFEDKLSESNVFLNDKMVIYFEEVDKIQTIHKIFTPNRNIYFTGDSSEYQSIVFYFFDGTEFEMNLNDYWKSEDIKEEIFKLVEINRKKASLSQ